VKRARRRRLGEFETIDDVDQVGSIAGQSTQLYCVVTVARQEGGSREEEALSCVMDRLEAGIGGVLERNLASDARLQDGFHVILLYFYSHSLLLLYRSPSRMQ